MIYILHDIIFPLLAGWGAVDLTKKFLAWWFMGPIYKDDSGSKSW
jgi:hypothetical protein